VLQLEQQTADARLTAIQSLTTAAGTIFEGLGPKFADALKTVQLAEFVQKTDASIKSLQGYKEALEAGNDAQDKNREQINRTNAAQAELTEQRQKAITTGLVPLKDATDDYTKQMEKAAKAAEGLDFAAMGREVDSLTTEFYQISSALSEEEIRFTEFGNTATKSLEDVTKSAFVLTGAVDSMGRSLDTVIGTVKNPIGQVGGPKGFTIGAGGVAALISAYSRVGFQGGGMVTAPTIARIAESGPEIVLGQPSRQAFAQEFAGAIAQYLEAGRGTSTVNLVVDGKTLAQVVVPAMLEQQRRRQIGPP
jgi:hypothetical protein